MLLELENVSSMPKEYDLHERSDLETCERLAIYGYDLRVNLTLELSIIDHPIAPLSLPEVLEIEALLQILSTPNLQADIE